MRKNGTNVSGQIHKKSLALIKGQNVKTHDIFKVKKGISFQDKVYKFGTKTKTAATRVAGNIGKSYTKYGKPTETLFRKAGSAALGAGKLALRFPGVGLAATGLYYGAKAIAKRQKGIKHPELRQFDKRARKILAGGSYRRGTKIT